MRVSWNGSETAVLEIADRLAAYREAGIGAVHISPDRGDIDAWLQTQQALADAVIG
jgi:hypothetical protein